jgi:hypothetical protein
VDPKEIGKEYKAYYDILRVLQKHMPMGTASFFTALILGYMTSPRATKPAQMKEFAQAVIKCMEIAKVENRNESN